MEIASILLDSIIIGSTLTFFIITILILVLRNKFSLKKTIICLLLIFIVVISVSHYFILSNSKLSLHRLQLKNGFEIINTDIGVYFKKQDETNIEKWTPISKFHISSDLITGYFAPGPYDKMSKKWYFLNITKNEITIFDSQTELCSYCKNKSIICENSFYSLERHYWNNLFWIFNPKLMWGLIGMIIFSGFLLVFIRKKKVF
ncbi:hypothetical protein BH09BAC5_BH09BAC5_17500 [soil metagenome]